MNAMKLWLLEILACPLDKYFPLECTILQWQGESQNIFQPPNTPNPISGSTDSKSNNNDVPLKSEDLIQQLLKAYHTGEIIPLDDKESTVQYEYIEGTWKICDELIIKPKPFIDYFEELLLKIKELTVISDKSTWKGEEGLELIQKQVKSHLKQHLNTLKANSKNEKQYKKNNMNLFRDKVIQPVYADLEFLNQFKYYLEIQEAVIFCPKCKRWFPVFETIPQMLPDGIRDSDSDTAFQKRWQNKYNFPTK
jgi:uncharacterized protein YbaR (Trm112 family)